MGAGDGYDEEYVGVWVPCVSGMAGCVGGGVSIGNGRHGHGARK
jgi:hypothetical protein